MKNGWKTKKFSAICELQKGRKPALFASASLPGAKPYLVAKYLRGNEPAGFASTRDKNSVCVEKHEIIIICDGSNSGETFIGFEGILSSTMAKIAHGPELDNKFLLYFLSSLFEQFNCGKTGAAIPHLDLASLREQCLPLPPLAEQKRIVGILDKAFAGIATTQANAEKNLQNARALFASVLDRAVTGKLSADWRSSRVNTESASEHLKRRIAHHGERREGTERYREPAAPVSSGPIDVPDGWMLASPEQFSTHIVDCPHSTPKWTNSGVACLRTTNFKPGHLDIESVQYVSEETYRERIGRLEPRPGDVLYSREGSILGIACTLPEGLRACLGQRMMLFRLDTNIALAEYFVGVLNSALILAEVRQLTGGAASPHLNICDIRRFPIPLPPIGEQQHIVGKLGRLSRAIEHLASIHQRKLAALDALKKSLLHQAFTGQL